MDWNVTPSIENIEFIKMILRDVDYWNRWLKHAVRIYENK